MDVDIWQFIPKELFSNIFRYLPLDKLNNSLIKYVSKSHIIGHLKRELYYSYKSDKLYVICWLYKKYNMPFDKMNKPVGILMLLTAYGPADWFPGTMTVGQAL